MKLTLKDKKLLYWLDQNSRASNKELAKNVGLSEQGIGYKLKTLEKEGIIRKYVTFVNTLALGYFHYKVLLRLQNTNPEKEEEIINYLMNHHNVRWVVACSGKWDINFSIMAKTPQDFTKIYRKIEFDFGDYIAEKNIFLLIKSPGFTKGYLINRNSLRTLEYKPVVLEKNLDKKDKDILKLMSQNARKSVLEIARKLNTTGDIVRYRIKKLEKEGIISGYTVQLDYEKVNLLRYSVFFSLHRIDQKVEERMLAFAKIHNNIIFIMTLIGSYDLSLELEVFSHRELQETIKKFREKFSENIRDFEIIFNTYEYKYNYFPF